MKIIYNEDIKDKLTVTIGSFDGIHLGHQKLLQRLLSDAKKNKSKSALITFSPHPRQVVNPEYHIELLNTDCEKKEILEHFGIDYLIIIEFSKSLRSLKPEEFIQRLIDHYNIAEFVIGYNHGFGKDRKGNSETICSILAPHNIKYTVINEVKSYKHKISSTIIRQYLDSYEYHKAAELLGYYFFITGKTVHGHKVGSKLGYPTININPPAGDKLTPCDGVYLVRIKIDKELFYGLTSIGSRPTFNDTVRVIETFVLNFSKKIYGKEVKIFFLKKIRNEVKFSTADKLSEQIAKDVQVANNILKEQSFEDSYFI